MNFDLNQTIDAIKNNKDFLKLKKIIENNSGHDHEVEYDHCIRSYEVAKEALNGDFITNPDAKRKFEDFLNQEIDGVKKRDILQIGALIHDIGKLIVFEENGQTKSLGSKNADGTFSLFPEHGYWGSLLVRNITSDTNLSEEILDYLTKFISLHAIAANVWLFEENLSAKESLWKTKIAAQGLHVDILISMYCDFFYHPLFKRYKPLMVEVFNLPETYETLKYSIMD